MPANEMNPVEECVSLSQRNLDPAKTPGLTGEILTAFLDEWFARYGDEYIAHHPDYYMSKGMTLSEDEIGACGTDVFESMFLPELVSLSEYYGGIGIHCCGPACPRGLCRRLRPCHRPIPDSRVESFDRNRTE